MGPAGPFFFETALSLGHGQMATTYEKEQKLLQQVAPRIESELAGVEVLALELMTPSRFCVYVDHPAGVDHALCKQITDVLRDLLREYTIDVSSPGIERPVRTPQHFAEAVGKKVALRTAEPVGGRSKFKGEVRQAGTDALTMSIDGADVDIPYESIVRGNLIDER
jgi:ribosome maturation factor RimP